MQNYQIMFLTLTQSIMAEIMRLSIIVYSAYSKSIHSIYSMLCLLDKDECQFLHKYLSDQLILISITFLYEMQSFGSLKNLSKVNNIHGAPYLLKYTVYLFSYSVFKIVMA